MRYPKPSSSSGTILFIVLLFIVAVTSLVLISNLRTASDIRFVENEVAKLRAYASCQSGLQVAIHRVLTSMKGRSELLSGVRRPFQPRLLLDGSEISVAVIDLIEQPYYDAIPLSVLEALVDARITLRLQDGAGLLNLLRTPRHLVINYLVSRGMAQETALAWMDAVMDWMDPDDFPRRRGAEKDAYRERWPGMPPNRVFLNREELLLLPGMDGDLFTKIRDHVTVSLLSQGLNPNTMPRPLFRVFPGLEREIVDRILVQRTQKEFETPEDLTLRSGFNFTAYTRALQFFTSNTLYATISAPMSDEREFFLRVELERPRMGMGGDRGRGRDPFRGRRRGPGADQGQKDLLGESIYIQNWLEGTREIQDE